MRNNRRIYGLVGYPIAHSRSPEWFHRLFQEKELDARYELFPAPTEANLRKVLEGNPQLQGLNVTIPHKQAIFQYLDELDPAAEVIGAVNCVLLNQGRRIGFNTDAPAFQHSLEGSLPEGGKALVLGTGGASRAVSYALDQMGIEWKKVSRKPSNTKEWSYDQIGPEVVEEHRLIINTTPLGAPPFEEDCPPIPYHTVSSSHFLYDLVYYSELTPFLRKGQQRGATIKNGKEMLHRQAALSWEIWSANQPIV